jgi:hypothetical protein
MNPTNPSNPISSRMLRALRGLFILPLLLASLAADPIRVPTRDIEWFP